MNHSAALCGLYVLTPDTPHPEAGLRYAAAALQGGARIMQYRDKTGDMARQRMMAQSLRDLTRKAGALLIINDSLTLALAVDADGVHLGQSDMPCPAARTASNASASVRTGSTGPNAAALVWKAELICVLWAWIMVPEQ